MYPLRIGIAVFVIAAIGAVVYLAPWQKPEPAAPAPVVEEVAFERTRTIGKSVEGREIEAHSYGNGDSHLLFVGGIHGGYEWNSVLLAYEAMDYFEENPTALPEDLTITIVPNANPDGVFSVVKKEGRFAAADVPKDSAAHGRFNANDVDLNRNFDCKWQPKSTWQGRPVSAGTKAFSEPEARAIRDIILETKPEVVVFWHSQANAVYASECEKGILPATLKAMKAYADAAKYPSVASFDAYPISGDAEGWLASIGIPAITVELSTHETIEWQKNLAGMRALLDLYSSAK